jgi:hypothetical protein
VPVLFGLLQHRCHHFICKKFLFYQSSCCSSHFYKSCCTAEQSVTKPPPVKSLGKSLLDLSDKTTNFLINNLKVWVAVWSFCSHFLFYRSDTDQSLLRGCMQPWNTIFTGSNKVSNTMNSHWCLLFESNNYSSFRGCNTYTVVRT